MIRQPIVYKPQNTTKYIDAYNAKVSKQKEESAKLQREREKERKAEQDKLGMYTNRKYASPVHQRAYDTYIKDFYAKAGKNPENFTFLLNETIPLIEGLDAENKSVSKIYNEAIKSGDYRNIEEFKNAFMANDGGERFDAYKFGDVKTKAVEAFGVLNKSFALGEYVSKEGNVILKNLASDPKTLSRYFNRDIQEKDLNDMTMTEIFTSVKPEAMEEVMEIILSSNPEAMGQALFDYSRGMNPDEATDNAIKMATQDLQSFLGVASITKTLKKGEGDGRGRGYDDINPKIYREKIRTGDTEGLDALKGAKIQGKEIISAVYSPDGKEVELTLRNIKSTKEGFVEEQLPMMVEVDDVDMWDNILRSRYKFDPKKWETLEEPTGYSGTPKDYTQDVKDVYDALYKVSISSKSPDEKTKEFQRILGRKDVEYNTEPNTDITIGDEDLDLFYMVGRGKKKLKEKFGQLIWETKDSWNLDGIKKEGELD